MKLVNIGGQRFGRLVAIQRAKNRGRRTLWECQCDCGRIKDIGLDDLRSGRTRSCGCLHDEGNRVTHGKSRTPAYVVWTSMRRRCFNVNDHDYKHYGGRGITVCERWEKFENFFEDMGERPNNLTLDRIDNDGNYEPSNCRWATQKEQVRNSRRAKLTMKKAREVRKLRASGYTLRKLAELFNVAGATISLIVHNRTWVDL